MSDITEDEVARALVEFQFPGCGEDEATAASHLPMARAVLAIVQPALERARVEERERCAKVADGMAEYMAIAIGKIGSQMTLDRYQVGANDMWSVAAAIRKAP